MSPKKQRRGIKDIHFFIEAAWQQCQAGLQREAYNLIQREGIFSDLGRWGGNAILLEICQQLLPLNNSHPETLQVAYIYHNQGLVYNDLGEKVQAKEFFQRALNIFRKVRNREREGMTLSDLAGVYDDLGQKEKAREFYEQALHLFKEIADLRGEAITLSKLGRVYKNLGQMKLAQKFYEQALRVYENIGSRRGIKGDWRFEGGSTTLGVLGGIYDGLGQQEKGLDFFEQALLKRRKLGDLRGEANVLYNLGCIYDDLGQKNQAKDCFRQAQKIFKGIGNGVREGITLYKLGRIYDDDSWDQKARECYKQALEIFEKLQHPDDAEIQFYIKDLRSKDLRSKMGLGLKPIEPLLEIVEMQRQRFQILEQASQEESDDRFDSTN